MGSRGLVDARTLGMQRVGSMRCKGLGDVSVRSCRG